MRRAQCARALAAWAGAEFSSPPTWKAVPSCVHTYSSSTERGRGGHWGLLAARLAPGSSGDPHLKSLRWTAIEQNSQHYVTSVHRHRSVHPHTSVHTSCTGTHGSNNTFPRYNGGLGSNVPSFFKLNLLKIRKNQGCKKRRLVHPTQ